MPRAARPLPPLPLGDGQQLVIPFVDQREEPRRPRRTKARRSDSPLTERDVKQLWKLHEAGLSVTHLAGCVWTRFGYANPASAANAIYRAFHLAGLQPRWRRTSRDARCAGCGVRHIQRTRGCDVCRNRHQRRSMKGLPYVSIAPTRCSGCGVDLDARTDGCEPCRHRHAKREKRRAA